jgi:DeoR family transcriptional regulator, suf operon transcriptional repressor
MKSTRDRILQNLLNQPRSTINELASSVGINAISVRHHLTSLQVEGLVTAEEERHGVGRPRLVYFLTDKGVERFPTYYLKLTSRLLSQLKESLPKPVLEKLLKELAARLAADYPQKGNNLNIQERLDVLKEILAQEGFTISWARQGDHYVISEVSCPYYHISHDHPELCFLDQSLISSLLALPVEQISCLLHGDQSCSYLIKTAAPALENI